MNKPLTGASVKDLPSLTNKIDFTKMMCVYSHERDKAVGLRLSKHTRGLVWYGETQQKLENKAIMNFFHLGVIKRAKERITEIKEFVNENTPPDEAYKLYREALLLQDTIKREMGVIGDG